MPKCCSFVYTYKSISGAHFLTYFETKGLVLKVKNPKLSRIIDHFDRKRCQKKCKDVDDKVLKEFFQKYFGAHEQFHKVKNLLDM